MRGNFTSAVGSNATRIRSRDGGGPVIECESIEYLAEQKVDLAMEMLKWVTSQQINFTILHVVYLRGRWVTANG